MKSFFTLGLILFSLVTISFISCGKGDKKKSALSRNSLPLLRTRFVPPKPVADDYVGSQACQQCHADILQEYQTHPMATSMSLPGQTGIEDFQSQANIPTTDQIQYSVKMEEERVIHQEQKLAVSGEVLTNHQEEISFTCGSGTRGCSYFIFREGRLFQSPITWYGKKSQWDLSPGYTPGRNPRFERVASDGCLACHAGRMNPIPQERNRFDEKKPFHELAIGCERCHGPGKKHIHFHDGNIAARDTVDPIVNPEKLSPELRDAVCYQCHLQGLNRITRYGRSEYDFRPGMAISDVWIPFLKTGDTNDNQVEAVSQVEQMQQSRCYIESDGKMGCISCHDPHSSPQESNRVPFFRKQCIACHASDQPAGPLARPGGDLSNTPPCAMPTAERLSKSPDDSCIGCHMPKLNAGDVPHTAQTNHRVHIPGKTANPPSKAREKLQIWVDRKVPHHVLSRARTIFQAEQAFMTKDPKLTEKALSGLADFYPQAQDDLALNEALAQLYYAKGDVDQAIQLWKSQLKLKPNDEFLLSQLALALQEEGKTEEAYTIYRSLISVNRSRPQTLKRFLDACTRSNRIDEGIQIAKSILVLDPGSQLTHAWLAKAYEKIDPPLADYHRNLAEKLPSVK